MALSADIATWVPHTVLKRYWWASLLVLGPVTGPLLGLCLVNLKAGRHVWSALCIAGIVAFWIAAPALLGAELTFISTHRITFGP